MVYIFAVVTECSRAEGPSIHLCSTHRFSSKAFSWLHFYDLTSTVIALLFRAL